MVPQPSFPSPLSPSLTPGCRSSSLQFIASTVRYFMINWRHQGMVKDWSMTRNQNRYTFRKNPDNSGVASLCYHATGVDFVIQWSLQVI
ncbi:unnamed protein product [Lactuca virosa]|uniref:Uncharacterized protein n=1 Tax=Lactuca virosa TaxID=75947 RepID=A0AAU9M2B2_9ASTR|nr:unnamed protein product [Lactuca virosa]